MRPIHSAFLVAGFGLSAIFITGCPGAIGPAGPAGTAVTIVVVATPTATATLGPHAFVRVIGSQGGFNGQFQGPTGIGIGPSGNIYVTDSNNFRVQGFYSNATFGFAFGSYTTGSTPFGFPNDVVTGVAGTIYVTDGSLGRIFTFTPAGGYLGSIGSPGSLDGQFSGPRGIAIGNSNDIYVVDSANQRVQKFDSSGVFQYKWGTAGSGDGQFNDPRGVVVGFGGEIYVVEYGNHRVQRFHDNGAAVTFMSKWGANGGNGTSGFGNGEFYYPQDVAFDPTGVVYVCDTFNNRIQSFDFQGNYQSKWGNNGSGNGQFSYPTGIVVNLSNRHVYVVDQLNHRVQEFGP